MSFFPFGGPWVSLSLRFSVSSFHCDIVGFSVINTRSQKHGYTLVFYHGTLHLGFWNIFWSWRLSGVRVSFLFWSFTNDWLCPFTSTDESGMGSTFVLVNKIFRRWSPSETQTSTLYDGHTRFSAVPFFNLNYHTTRSLWDPCMGVGSYEVSILERFLLKY